MLPVVVAATQWGIGSGIVAAVAGAAAADFFFYPPLYTLWIRDPQNVVDLVLFLLIALVTSNLAARLKNEAVELRRREKEIGELHAFSQGLATCLTSRDLIFAVQDYLSNTLRYRAVLIATAQDDKAADDGTRRSGRDPAGGGETDRGRQPASVDRRRSASRPGMAGAGHHARNSRLRRHRGRARRQPGRTHGRYRAARRERCWRRRC